jgi:hypothetical protein
MFYILCPLFLTEGMEQFDSEAEKHNIKTVSVNTN